MGNKSKRGIQESVQQTPTRKKRKGPIIFTSVSALILLAGVSATMFGGVFGQQATQSNTTKPAATMPTTTPKSAATHVVQPLKKPTVNPPITSPNPPVNAPVLGKVGQKIILTNSYEYIGQVDGHQEYSVTVASTGKSYNIVPAYVTLGKGQQGKPAYLVRLPDNYDGFKNGIYYGFYPQYIKDRQGLDAEEAQQHGDSGKGDNS